ncbi:TERF1-interacting nuclear factor 2 isoform X2 [Poecile atricapillus]|uniref:TERF1-interacting nuclear factor 2 isoform X2 n=1 Tax=Poecile atricapillus TaxID=48891 RepID=UPI0027385D6D|nr:TERF1-interacting nuclear factor 2 isoform X2 [Poecile atricapillus]
MSGSDVSPSPSLRLAMAGAWWALRGRGLGGRGLDGRGLDGRGLDGRGWGRLLALLEAVGGGAPALLRPRHRARLSLGLRAQVVTSLLRELGPSPAVLDALDWLFPEGAGPAAGHALGTLQGRPLVAVAEESFREQVLGILGSGRGLQPFLEEYGPRFRNSLGNLFLEFLLRLESALPPPDLAQLDALCRSHAPPGFRTRPLPILRRYWAEVGHAHPAPVPRPIPARKTTPMVKPRPQRRRLRPLRFSPYHADGKGDRDRHRTHGQGGADQGARGGEGRDPPPAAAADLQREANER